MRIVIPWFIVILYYKFNKTKLLYRGFPLFETFFFKTLRDNIVHYGYEVVQNLHFIQYQPRGTSFLSRISCQYGLI